jgi:NADH-quinone oxidoreductase subunit N
MLNNLAPEIILLFIALLALCFSMFKVRHDRLIAITNLLLVGQIVFLSFSTIAQSSIKIILLIFCCINNLLFAHSLSKVDSEYVALMLFSCLGSFIVVSSQDFLTLFMGLELQALASYILSAMMRSSPASSEAGVKYFSLGALATCIMLLGISFIYGASGGIAYSDLALLENTHFSALAKFGILLVVASLSFKLSSAPFHMWAPDVYQGSPSISLNVFISINKLTSLLGLVGLLGALSSAKSLVNLLQPFFIFCACLSLVVGSFGALKQTNFKRFLAYSSIFDVGFLLLFFIVFNGSLLGFSVLYLLAYTLSVMLILSILTSIGINVDDLEISDLAGIYHTNKLQSVLLGICLFSLMGIPPLLGFVAKFSILLLAVWDASYYLAIFASITTLVSSYYYLRIIKTIFLSPLPNSSPDTRLSPLSLQVLNVLGAVCLILSWMMLPAFYS